MYTKKFIGRGLSLFLLVAVLICAMLCCLNHLEIKAKASPEDKTEINIDNILPREKLRRKGREPSSSISIRSGSNSSFPPAT